VKVMSGTKEMKRTVKNEKEEGTTKRENGMRKEMEEEVLLMTMRQELLS